MLSYDTFLKLLSTANSRCRDAARAYLCKVKLTERAVRDPTASQAEPVHPESRGTRELKGQRGLPTSRVCGTPFVRPEFVCTYVSELIQGTVDSLICSYPMNMNMHV